MLRKQERSLMGLDKLLRWNIKLILLQMQGHYFFKKFMLQYLCLE